MNQALGWLLGLKNVKSIDEVDPSLAASWAAGGTFWVFFALAALLVAALVFYLKYQHRGSRARGWPWGSAAACCWSCCC